MIMISVTDFTVNEPVWIFIDEEILVWYFPNWKIVLNYKYSTSLEIISLFKAFNGLKSIIIPFWLN